MSATVLYRSMSLDGFVAGPNEGPNNGLGDGGERLHELVHGAGTAQLALAAGVLDELEIHLIPVLLGQGCRLFDHLRPEHIELERTQIIEGEAAVTHMHYRVQR